MADRLSISRPDTLTGTDLTMTDLTALIDTLNAAVEAWAADPTDDKAEAMHEAIADYTEAVSGCPSILRADPGV